MVSSVCHEKLNVPSQGITAVAPSEKRADIRLGVVVSSFENWNMDAKVFDCLQMKLHGYGNNKIGKTGVICLIRHILIKGSTTNVISLGQQRGACRIP
jgi:hypothetical protein